MSGREPLVSIVLPTYNRASVIGRAIRSVVCQTLPYWELIIVDDGSSDHTHEVVQEFKDDRIRYFRQSVNRGPAAARNFGIRQATCEYIAFLDSDDEWLPDKLAKQLAAFRKCDPTVGIIYTGAIFVDVITGWIRIKHCRARGWIEDEEIAYNPVGTPSRVMVRRECFVKCGGFDEDLPTSEDWDMWIRISRHYQIDYIDEPLVRYIEHANSRSADVRKMIAGYAALCRKYNIDKRERWIRAIHSFRLGHRLCYWGATSSGRPYLAQSLLLEPWRVERTIPLVLSLFGSGVYRRTMLVLMRLLG